MVSDTACVFFLWNAYHAFGDKGIPTHCVGIVNITPCFCMRTSSVVDSFHAFFLFIFPLPFCFWQNPRWRSCCDLSCSFILKGLMLQVKLFAHSSTHFFYQGTGFFLFSGYTASWPTMCWHARFHYLSLTSDMPN